MPEVNRYRVVFYGSSSDKPNLKAKVELYAGPKDKGGQAAAVCVGKIKFHDGVLPADGEEKGSIVMNLPHDTLPAVVDMLRNESPVYFAFHEGRAVLGTGIEDVGTRDEHVPQLVKIVEAATPRPVPPNVPTPAS